MWTGKDGREQQVTPPPGPARTQFAGQLDHLAQCVRSGREPIVSGEEGLRDMRIVEAIYRSAREGRTIRLGGTA
jgi:glucose-fructose oxidoreductase